MFRDIVIDYHMLIIIHLTEIYYSVIYIVISLASDDFDLKARKIRLR